MNRRLFFKTFVAMFGLSFATLLIFSYFFNRQQERMIIQVMEAQARTVAQSIALLGSDAMVTNDQGVILENNLNILKKSPNIRYIVIDPRRGDTIVSTPNGWRIEPLLPRFKAMEKPHSLYAIFKSFLSGGEEVFHYVYPLDFNGFEWGWLHLGFSTEQIKTMRHLIYRQGLMIAGFILLMTLLGSYIFSRWLTIPIIQLNNAAKSAASGKLDIMVQTRRKDEIGELVESFNRMIQNLRDNQTQLRTANRMLEEKVQQRTRELEQLNTQLEEKVKKEVAKSREKDQMLIQQSRLASMGEMIGNIAHQWRQPLNALGLVLQNIQMAHEHGRLDEEYLRKATDKGMKLIDSMSHTIDDFRNFFKPNKSKERFDIAQSIDSALEMVESSFKNHDINVNLQLEPELCALGFPSEFSQVLLNILTNAKDALLERNVNPKEIWIHAFRQNTDIVVTIEDNGGGIDTSVVEKIFDPYFTTKEEGKGTGLGLYMSKMIIERSMNGTIVADNGSSGARFTTRIPAETKGCT